MCVCAPISCLVCAVVFLVMLALACQRTHTDRRSHRLARPTDSSVSACHFVESSIICSPLATDFRRHAFPRSERHRRKADIRRSAQADSDPTGHRAEGSRDFVLELGDPPPGLLTPGDPLHHWVCWHSSFEPAQPGSGLRPGPGGASAAPGGCVHLVHIGIESGRHVLRGSRCDHTHDLMSDPARAM